MENEITVKIKLASSVAINQNLYIDIINGLNDKYVPCNEIYLNDNLVFSNQIGFVSGGGNDDK